MILAAEQDNQPITAVISHLVKPGRESDYEHWLQGIADAAQKFDGHMGVSIIRPDDPTYPEYVSVLRFDRYQNLKQWMESDIRKNWIEWAKPLIQKDESVQTLTGLEAWFTLPNRPLRHPPPRYKMATLTLVAVFVLSNILPRLLGALIAPFPALVRSLILSSISIWLLTYIVMPQLTRLFYPWLYPPEH